ncbi:MAG: ATP-binding protein [Longimicrobiales bacterium]
MSAESREGAGPLDAAAAEAQRALQERPSLSIRKRLGVGLLLWFLLSLAITVVSLLLIDGVQEKLHIVGAVDRYTFAIQQARRYEKNYFLYGTNLADALADVHVASVLIDQESGHMAAVIGEAAVDTMRGHVRRYEQLLSQLTTLDSEDDARRIRDIESELRVHGAEMVRVAEDLATRERRAVESMLVASQRMAMAFMVVLIVLMILLLIFMARQVLAPLNRIMMATRRIAEGDLTPIMPRRRYHDEFSELAGAINYMMRELVRRQELLVQTHKLQAIGTLTAGVAHELNNPINNLMLTADALREDYEELSDEDRLDMVFDMVHESERARDIVRNLLDFARKSDVDLQSLDVEQLIGETLQLASNQIKLRKVKVQGEVEERLPPVYGDRQQLTQVFLNLVLNALDAMGEGGVLTIEVQQSPDRESVEIAFADTGSGIPRDQVDNVFDPFFSTKKHGKGTGLGLSVSLGIIKQHGGDMRVTSTEGEGTVFTVSLPVAKVPAGVVNEEEVEIPGPA